MRNCCRPISRSAISPLTRMVMPASNWNATRRTNVAWICSSCLHRPLTLTTWPTSRSSKVASSNTVSSSTKTVRPSTTKLPAARSILDTGPSTSSTKEISDARASPVVASIVPPTDTIMPSRRPDSMPGSSSIVTVAFAVSNVTPLTTTLPKPVIGPTATTFSSVTSGKGSGVQDESLSPQAVTVSATSAEKTKPLFMTDASSQANAAEIVDRNTGLRRTPLSLRNARL